MRTRYTILMQKFLRSHDWVKYTRLTLCVTALLPIVYTTSTIFPGVIPRATFFGLCLGTALLMHVFACIRGNTVFAYGKSTILLGLLIVVGVVATVFSPDPLQSLWSKPSRMEGLILYFEVLVYTYLLLLYFDTTWWRRYFITFCVSSGILLLFGLAQYAQFDVHDAEVRVDALFGNPVFFASAMLIACGSAALLYTLIRTKQAKRIVLISGILFAVGVYVTATRSALLGLLAGLATSVCLIVYQYRKDRQLLTRIFFGALLFFVVCGSVFVAHQKGYISVPIIERFSALDVQNLENQTRYFLYTAAFEGVRERPIFGHGYEQFDEITEKHLLPSYFKAQESFVPEWWHDRTHSIHLELLVQLGVTGLLLWYALVGYAFYVLWRSTATYAEKACVTGLFVAIIVHITFNFFTITDLVLFFALIAYCLRHEELQKYTVSQLALYGRVVVVIFAIVGLTLSVLHVHRFAYAAEVRTLLNTTDEGSLKRIIGYYALAQENAIDREYAARELWYESSIFLTEKNVTTKDIEEVTSYIVNTREAVRNRGALSPRDRFYLGVAYCAAGKYSEATTIFEEGLHEAPHNLQLLTGFAECLFKTQEYEHGNEILKAARTLESTYRPVVLLSAAGMYYTGQITEGDAFLTTQFDNVYVLHPTLIDAYIEAKMYDRAATLLKSALEKYPKDIRYTELRQKLEQSTKIKQKMRIKSKGISQ